MKKKLKIIILLGILTFVTFESAYANSPIGGAMVIALPWFSSLVSSGLALIVVILIEMLVLKQKLDLKYFEAGKLSLYANIFSTLMGMIIVLAYSSSFSVFLLFWILGSIFLLNFFNFISKKTGFLKHFASCKILLPLPFFAIGLIGLIFGSLLTPVLELEPDPKLFLIKLFLMGPYSKYELLGRLIVIISLIILLILGFIITFLSEGYVITKLYSEKSDKIVSTVMSMNLISYIVLALIFILLAPDPGANSSGLGYGNDSINILPYRT